MAVVAWGDGTSDTATVVIGGNTFSYIFSGTHTYADNGSYNVQVSITNNAGAAGTSGFTEPFYRLADVPAAGSGFLIGPADTSRFRYNIGIRTLDNPVSVTITVKNADGNTVHTVINNYPKNFFLQTSVNDFLGFSLANNQSLQLSFDGGLIAYGATVDNVTNDSSAQFLSYAPTQIASARASGGRRSPSATPLLFAAVLAMLGVGVGAVVSRR